jgi:hypothetical protein
MGLDFLWGTEPEFDSYWDALARRSDVPSIYRSSHARYYHEVSGQTLTTDFSCLVTRGGSPEVGVKLHLAKDGGRNVLNYFGNAGYFISRRPAEENNEAFELISSKLMERGLRTALATPELQLAVQIQPSWLERPSKAISQILGRASSIEARFTRYVQVASDDERHFQNWPKSVKEALRKADSMGIQSLVLTGENNRRAIVDGFLDLRALHFESAGRYTRSELSWNLQLESIFQGHGFLVLAKLEGKTLGAAYFLASDSDCYYGVSANAKRSRDISVGHVVLVAAIRHASSIGLDKVWVGSQFSGQTGQATDKEVQIENFKSYFGQNLSVSILLATSVRECDY